MSRACRLFGVRLFKACPVPGWMRAEASPAGSGSLGTRDRRPKVPFGEAAIADHDGCSPHAGRPGLLSKVIEQQPRRARQARLGPQPADPVRAPCPFIEDGDPREPHAGREEHRGTLGDDPDAQPLLRQAADHVIAIGADAAAEPSAEPRGMVPQQRAQRPARVLPDDLMVEQLGEGHARIGRERMVRPHHRHQLVAEAGMGPQPRWQHLRGQHAQIRLAGLQRLQHVAVQALVERNGDAGIRRQEAAEAVGQDADQARLARAQSDVALHLRAQGAHGGLQFGGLAQDVAGMAEKHRPGGGGLDARGVAAQQRPTEPRLEIGHALADRRGSGVLAPGGGGDAALLDNGDEEAGAGQIGRWHGLRGLGRPAAHAIPVASRAGKGGLLRVVTRSCVGGSPCLALHQPGAVQSEAEVEPPPHEDRTACGSERPVAGAGLHYRRTASSGAGQSWAQGDFRPDAIIRSDLLLQKTIILKQP